MCEYEEDRKHNLEIIQMLKYAMNSENEYDASDAYDALIQKIAKDLKNYI